MKKLVSESIQEFRKKKALNEENIFQKIGQAVKSAFDKVGKFFIGLFNGEPVPSMVPANIGVMDRDRMINSAISYIPSKADIALDPGLVTLTEERALQKRGPDNITESFKELFEDRVPLEHPNKNIRNVKKDELYKLVRMVIKNPQSRPYMIWGAPGIGKTQIVQAVLRARSKGRLIDVPTSKMAPDDWALPAIYKSSTGEMAAADIPKSWLPVYKPSDDPEENAKRDNIANGGSADGKVQGEGGIIFFDELSRANPAVQNTCLKIMDERLIGDQVFGSKWAVIAASNRQGDDPDADISFGKALGNRFSQVNYMPDFESWKEWAIDKIDPRIIDFLEFNRDYFYTMDDDPDAGIFASPRTWEEASIKMAQYIQDSEEEGERINSRDLANVVGDNVGMDIAKEFEVFLRLLESFKKEDIRKILEKPDKAPLPKKAGSGYDQSEANAILSLVITSTRGKQLPPEEFNNFCKYLVRLDNASLATRAIKMMFSVHPYMNEELGDIEGRDKYKEGVDLFIDKYKDIF